MCPPPPSIPDEKLVTLSFCITCPLDEVSGFSSEVGREVQTGMEDLVDGSLPVLATEWRLRNGTETNYRDVVLKRSGQDKEK